jgi:hypothetical protein
MMVFPDHLTQVIINVSDNGRPLRDRRDVAVGVIGIDVSWIRAIGQTGQQGRGRSGAGSIKIACGILQISKVDPLKSKGLGFGGVKER